MKKTVLFCNLKILKTPNISAPVADVAVTFYK